MTPKELITKIKEYADVADASYAMLHYIEENEVFDIKDDEWKAKYSKEPPARWIYADGIKRGYEISSLTKEAKDNHRSIGQPTAYALSIEARFTKDKLIKLDENEKPKKIDNTIQNFIKRDKDNPSLENQKIQVSTTKEKMIKERTSHYLSYRTKAFTSRYEVLHHQKNTEIGYCATLFLDTWAKNEEEKYILAFRGTEMSDIRDIETDLFLGNIYFSWVKQILETKYPEQEIKDPPSRDEISSKQMIVVMALIEKDLHFFKNPNSEEYKALISINPQVASLVEHREVVFEIMRNLTKKEDFKLNLVGHSLGGNLAQAFCLITEEKYISSLYTYNAPGFGGIGISRMGVFARTIGIIGGLIKKSPSKLKNKGFTRNTMENCVAYCTPNETLEDYIVYEKELRQTGGDKATQKSAGKAQQLCKAKSGIDIHHIETISQPIPLVDSFTRTFTQFVETAPSVVADLGVYKYGLPSEIQEDKKIIKYELANTDKLHLLHIGGLNFSYYMSSHYMENILQVSYFYDYLLKQKDNQNKQAFCGEIANSFNYLASYTQVLIDLISYGKLLKNRNNKINFITYLKETFYHRNYLFAYLEEIFYVLEHKKSYVDKKVEMSFAEEKDLKETLDISMFKNSEKVCINSNNIFDALMVLHAYNIYTKIIDKYDAERMGG